MTDTPSLLAPDGSASVATFLMMAHHGFRRDLVQLRRALPRLDADGARTGAIVEEWKFYREALHGHHQAEDNGIFPALRGRDGALAPVIDRLGADHQRMDPLLARGDALFASLGDARARAEAGALLAELSDFLEPHLALEEERITPFLRGQKSLPYPVASDEMAKQMAEGFAWSMHGIAPEVVSAVSAALPEAVTARLPAARAAYAARCVRAWGTADAGASRGPVPDWLGAI